MDVSRSKAKSLCTLCKCSSAPRYRYTAPLAILLCFNVMPQSFRKAYASFAWPCRNKSAELQIRRPNAPCLAYGVRHHVLMVYGKVKKQAKIFYLVSAVASCIVVPGFVCRLPSSTQSWLFLDSRGLTHRQCNISILTFEFTFPCRLHGWHNSPLPAHDRTSFSCTG